MSPNPSPGQGDVNEYSITDFLVAGSAILTGGGCLLIWKGGGGLPGDVALTKFDFQLILVSNWPGILYLLGESTPLK